MVVLWLLLCLVVAFAMAWLQYSGRQLKSRAERFQRIVLMSLRSLAIAIFLVVLLGVALKRHTSQEQPPLVVLAQDNSSSVAMNADSAWVRNAYCQQFNALRQRLDKKFDVRVLAFADAVTETERFAFDGQSTNMSSVFDYVQNNFYGENVGAIVIASDGIVNQGADPLYRAGAFSKPVYTIALGDTLPHPDLSIDRVASNRTAYRNSRFPIMVYVKGQKVPDGDYVLKISEKDRLIEQRTITVKSDYSYQKELFYLEEDEVGLHQYVIQVDVPQNDVNAQNNKHNVVVNVSDDVLEVLLLQNSWHPDASAISQVLRKNQRYNLTISNVSDFDGNVGKYSLIILHQLPSLKNNVQNIVSQAKKNEIPLLVIVGSQTDVKALSGLGVGIDIKQKHSDYENAYPALNADFKWFTVDFDATQTSLFPPLNVPYGDYGVVPTSQVLFYQRIGSVATQMPLVYFTQTSDLKVGVICGEGIWRWRLTDYMAEKSHSVTDEIIGKTIQYLSVREKRERLAVTIDEVIPAHRDVVAEAMLYNKSMELVNSVDVDFVVTDESGYKFKSAFQPSEMGYVLNLGRKPAGKYTYEASAKIGDETFVKKGQFVVVEESAEMNNLQADHSLLYQLATDHGGQMVPASQMDEIVQMIENDKNVASVAIVVSKVFRAVDSVFVLLLSVFLLCAEWFLRKFWGMD